MHFTNLIWAPSTLYCSMKHVWSTYMFYRYIRTIAHNIALRWREVPSSQQWTLRSLFNGKALGAGGPPSSIIQVYEVRSLNSWRSKVGVVSGFLPFPSLLQRVLTLAQLVFSIFGAGAQSRLIWFIWLEVESSKKHPDPKQTHTN
jgi:hypothetical protein